MARGGNGLLPNGSRTTHPLRQRNMFHRLDLPQYPLPDDVVFKVAPLCLSGRDLVKEQRKPLRIVCCPAAPADQGDGYNSGAGWQSVMGAI